MEDKEVIEKGEEYLRELLALGGLLDNHDVMSEEYDRQAARTAQAMINYEKSKGED